MTAETYLRRALYAPVFVPLLSAVPLVLDALRGHTASNMATATAMALLYPLIVGGIPYLWMLWSKRDDLQGTHGEQLEAAMVALPTEMLPYFWKFWGALSLLLIPTGYGFFAGLSVLVAGTFAVPIAGYLYVAVTFAFLRGFQQIGLIPPTR